MTIRTFQIPASFALAVFLGCSASGGLVMDSVAPQAAIAQDVDDGFFYANLAPHGQWFFQAEFGWVWHPARVNAGWRPYTEGQWVWAGDAGWTWASQEPWGWATYHYGRWYFDPMYGWSWVPGRTWAPAWVSWRIESGYVGWAPLWPVYFDLHPEYRWDRWHHDHDWDRRHHGRDWDRWVFTRDRDFTSERVGRHAIADRRQRDDIYSRSRDVTQFDENNPERIGHSIDRVMIEKAVGRPIRSVKLENVDKPGKRESAGTDRMQVFRPRVKETRDRTPDRLGLAKEPKRESPEADTLRQEKTRLDGVAAKGTRGGNGVDGARQGGKPQADRVEPETKDEKPTARPQAERSDSREPAGHGRDRGASAEPEKPARSGGRDARAEKASPMGRQNDKPDGERTQPAARREQPRVQAEPKRQQQDPRVQSEPKRQQQAPRVQVQPKREQQPRVQAEPKHQQQAPRVQAQPKREQQPRVQAEPKHRQQAPRVQAEPKRQQQSRVQAEPKHQQQGDRGGAPEAPDGSPDGKGNKLQPDGSQPGAARH